MRGRHRRPPGAATIGLVDPPGDTGPEPLESRHLGLGIVDADVQVRKNGTSVSGRSIMGLMMLAAASGTVIEISATGEDAATAVETLARLIECKFDED